MNDVSKGEGRTVLFVSHNMGSIVQLCSKGIVLKNGNMYKSGDAKAVIDDYLKGDQNNDSYIQGLKRQIKKYGLRRYF